MKEIERIPWNGRKVVSTFSGGGGSCLGYRMAGYHVVYANEFVEEVLGNTYEIDEMLVDEYYKIKSENAYTQEQIQSKRKSLEGVLVPITATWNEELLRSVGFRKVDCFWRYLNFAAWVAVK